MERIIIMVKNEVGVIADITGLLAESGVNLLTINTESADGTGIVIIKTDENDRALDVLTSGGFKAVIDDALVIRLRDEPGALARVAEKLKHAGVNIQSLHILDRYDGYATVALSADDRAKAEALVDSESLL
jgi:hypothetical protein